MSELDRKSILHTARKILSRPLPGQRAAAVEVIEPDYSYEAPTRHQLWDASQRERERKEAAAREDLRRREAAHREEMLRAQARAYHAAGGEELIYGRPIKTRACGR